MDEWVLAAVVLIVLVLVFYLVGWELSLVAAGVVVGLWYLRDSGPVVGGAAKSEYPYDFRYYLKELGQQCTHLHQEATRRVIRSLMGEDTHELSGADVLPEGDQYRATSQVLPYWRKPGGGAYLDLDGWNAHWRLGWEYRGPVHQSVEQVRLNDRTKAQLAKKHGIKLLVVDYRIPPELVTRYIYTKLAKWKIPMVVELRALSASQLRTIEAKLGSCESSPA